MKNYILQKYLLIWNLAKALEMSITIFSIGRHSPFQTLLPVVQQMGPRQQEELNWSEVQLLATIKTQNKHTHKTITKEKSQHNLKMRQYNFNMHAP